MDNYDYKEVKENDNNILRQNNNNISSNKTGNCKACQYTAKNIYTDIREKNSLKNQFPQTAQYKYENQKENEREENKSKRK